MESASGLSLTCSVPDCSYSTAVQPPPYNLLELGIHTKVVHSVDVGTFPTILHTHSGPLPLLTASLPLTNEKVTRTETATLKVIATGDGLKSQENNKKKTAAEKKALEAERKAAEAEEKRR